MTTPSPSKPTEISASFAAAQLADGWTSPEYNDVSKPTGDIKIAPAVAPELKSSFFYQEDSEFIEGGFEGWTVICGCALVSVSTIGWNLIWGVFETYHADHMLKGTSDAQLSAVGAVQNSLMTFLSFIFGKLGDR
ncbi:hypothetical protein FRC07_002300 [Ceratobasidium sp. 392]|nr:hypothetical protein FRC07_002300 [Ceratobasidium sp. 392]